MVLPPDLWSIKKNKTVIRKTYQLPDSIDGSYLEQLIKVYSSCIHSTEYLPCLFNEDNAQQILKCGVYAAERLQPLANYT